jgi:predicted small secreted protein
MRTVKVLILATFALSLAASLAACNTVQGVGKDIESVGKKGEQVLDKERK